MPSFSHNVYDLPLQPEADILRIGYDSPAHTGPFEGAVDLMVAVDTPVIAPLDGEVLEIVDGNTEHGPTEAFARAVNYIRLGHENGEYSEYLHLAAGRMAVAKGDSVRAGELLGTTGLSGWMTEPHLHWLVYALNGSAAGFTGLQPRLTRSAQSIVDSLQ